MYHVALDRKKKLCPLVLTQTCEADQQTYPKVGSGKTVGSRDGRGGRSVSVKGIDVGQQGAHDGRHARAKVLGGQAMEVGHGLVDWLDAETHGKLLHQFLRRLVEVNLPALFSFGRGRKLHPAVMDLLREVVEEVLVQAGVLHVIRGHLMQ